MVAELNTNVDEATLQLRRAEAAYLGRVVERNADLYQRKLLPAGDYDEMTSRSRQAQLQVALQQAILAERSIKSPFDGVVAERYAGPGDRINDNKIVKLAQIDPLVVKVVARRPVRPDQADAGAQVTVNAAISDKPLQAKVWRIDRVMDAASGTHRAAQGREQGQRHSGGDTLLDPVLRTWKASRSPAYRLIDRPRRCCSEFSTKTASASRFRRCHSVGDVRAVFQRAPAGLCVVRRRDPSGDPGGAGGRAGAGRGSISSVSVRERGDSAAPRSGRAAVW